MNVLRIACASLLTCAAACSGYPHTASAPAPLAPNEVDAATKTGTGLTLQVLEHGQAAFNAHCNNCHGYPDIKTVDRDEWPDIMKRMGKNAKLTRTEQDEVLAYVQLIAATRK